MKILQGTVKGNVIKLSNNLNQIYLDTRRIEDGMWVLEQYEYTDNGTDMYSVFDSFDDLEAAIRYGNRLNPKNSERLHDEYISEVQCA
jgi:hypothetical protein